MSSQPVGFPYWENNQFLASLLLPQVYDGFFFAAASLIGLPVVNEIFLPPVFLLSHASCSHFERCCLLIASSNVSGFETKFDFFPVAFDGNCSETMNSQFSFFVVCQFLSNNELIPTPVSPVESQLVTIFFPFQLDHCV